MATTIQGGGSNGSGVRNAGFESGADVSAKGVENANAGMKESAEFDNKMEGATRNENHNKLTKQFLQQVEKNQLEAAKKSIDNMV